MKKDFKDLSNWIKTNIKRHEIWFCLPGEGTIVMNKYNAHGATYKGDLYWKPTSVSDSIKQSAYSHHHSKCGTYFGWGVTGLSGENIVMSGAANNLRTVNMGWLANHYTFEDGTEINSETLKTHTKPVKVVGTNGRVQTGFDWVKGISKESTASDSFNNQFNKYFAFRFDDMLRFGFNSTIAFQARPGDIFVCPSVHGQLNLNAGWLYSKEEYVKMFNLRGCSDLVDSKYTEINTNKPTFSLLALEGEKFKNPDDSIHSYTVVARVLDGGKISGYQVTDNNDGASYRIDRLTLCYLLGKNKVTNCKGRISNNDRGVQITGVGVNLESLPVIDASSGEISRNAEMLGKIKEGSSAEFNVNKFMAVGVVKSADGKRVDGYILQNSGGSKKYFSREAVTQMAVEGKIANIRTQNYNGNVLLRSVAGLPSLKDLPAVNADGSPRKQSNLEVFKGLLSGKK
jgi:hypothetical protein